MVGVHPAELRALPCEHSDIKYVRLWEQSRVEYALPLLVEAHPLKLNDMALENLRDDILREVVVEASEEDPTLTIEELTNDFDCGLWQPPES
ncbi:hypothetical protein KIN20_004661 [Parelaphostrongylus tenuis]|uniref:Uncharacterized protein n=1 Tax=Parelaphostrongylus tenuis TaxID=148309 RepID=A0AAD5MHL6_PARTN|nr:hypothetical protein KIN20_004661 [Parelaphostrongylus tenuis]